MSCELKGVMYGMPIFSSMSFPELEYTARDKLQDGNCSLTVLAGHVANFDRAELIPLWTLQSGEPWAEYCNSGNIFFVEFPGMVIFELAADDLSIRFSPLADSVPDVTIRHLLLDQIIPLYLSLKGNIVLHCAAAIVEGKAAVFLGTSGKGKSTLCASFHNAGVPVLTDDSVLLTKSSAGQYYCRPNYPGLRLYSDSKDQIFGTQIVADPMAHYTNKLRIIPEFSGVNNEPIEIGGFYHLGDEPKDEQISIFDLLFNESLISLLESTFRLDIKNKGMLTNELDALTDLCTTIPCKRICYPRTYESLPEVRRCLISDFIANQKQG